MFRYIGGSSLTYDVLAAVVPRSIVNAVRIGCAGTKDPEPARSGAAIHALGIGWIAGK